MAKDVEAGRLGNPLSADNPVEVGSTPTGIAGQLPLGRQLPVFFGNLSVNPGTPSAPMGTVTVELVNASPIGS